MQERKMTRASQTLSLGLLAASVQHPNASQSTSLNLLTTLRFQIYTILLLGLVPLPQKIQEDLIPVVSHCLQVPSLRSEAHTRSLAQLPFWVLISFGAFLLGKLGYGVLTFNDVPEAHEQLQQEIEQARADLKKRGVEVD